MTGWTFLVACLAIAGVPGFSGYFSKDLILEEAYAAHIAPSLYVVGNYRGRDDRFLYVPPLLCHLLEETRASHEVTHHIHESPWTMTGPLVSSLCFRSLGIGGYFPVGHWLEPIFGGHHAARASAGSVAADSDGRDRNCSGVCDVWHETRILPKAWKSLLRYGIRGLLNK